MAIIPSLNAYCCDWALEVSSLHCQLLVIVHFIEVYYNVNC